MQERQPSLFARDDTFLGACEAIGEDLGFNPLYLRLALGVALLWNPVAAAAAYASLVVAALASRLIAPDPRRSRCRERRAAPQMAEAANETTATSEALAA